MKKYISLILALFCLTGILTGCVRSNVGIKLNKDCTGSISTTISIEERAYNELLGMGEDVFEGKTTTTSDYDGKTYISYTESTQYSSFEDIEAALLEMTYATDELEDCDNTKETNSEDMDTSAEAVTEDNSHIFKNVDIQKKSGLFYSTYSFSAELNTQDIVGNNENVVDIDVPTDDMFHMTLTIEMPDKITQSNGGTVEETVVVFDFNDLGNTTEISAVSEQTNAGIVIAIVVILIVILILLLVILKRKKR